MLLPTSVTLTAPRPEPATPITTERMLVWVRSVPVGASAFASFSVDCLSVGTIQAGKALGAISLAEMVTLEAAVTVESLIVAVTVLPITLPTAVTWRENPPEPDTPMVSVRMMADDSEVRSRVELVSSVEPAMVVSIVLVMTLAATAAPRAAPPLPDTPKARASIVDVSLAERVTAPVASTSERAASSLRMAALVVFAMTLPERDSSPAPAPEPATPPVNPRMLASERAVSSRVEPLVTVDPEICASTLFVMTFTPAITPAATPPAPATLKPIELMVELSDAERSTNPPAAAMLPPSIVATIVFVMTFPKPVALMPTPDAAARPALNEIIPDVESAETEIAAFGFVIVPSASTPARTVE